MASRKSRKPEMHPLNPRDAADYTHGILRALERIALGNSHALLAHLLEMARREALWLSKQ